MISDDGAGAAERQAGIDYTLELIKKRYTLSTQGPWTTIRGFEVVHDRAKRTVTMKAQRLIRDGVPELMADEVRFRPAGPCASDISDLKMAPLVAADQPGYEHWRDNVTWFKKAAGWAIHVSMVHMFADYTLSVLCGLAISPCPKAVKAMKHLICWFEVNVDEGITWGGGPTDPLAPPPTDVIIELMSKEGGPKPWCLHAYADSDLTERSRYCAIAKVNGGPVWSKSRIQPSVAVDITDSESFAYSVASIMCEVLRGKMEDMGYAHTTEQETVIGGDNDAVLRIAASASAAKRALHILRRMGHTRDLTDAHVIKGAKVPRHMNLADLGTHYVTRTDVTRLAHLLRGGV
jgi:hypothetical protein